MSYEIKLGVWVKSEAARLKTSVSNIWARIHRGQMQTPKQRKVNNRVIWVTLEGDPPPVAPVIQDKCECGELKRQKDTLCARCRRLERQRKKPVKPQQTVANPGRWANPFDDEPLTEIGHGSLKILEARLAAYDLSPRIVPPKRTPDRHSQQPIPPRPFSATTVQRDESQTMQRI